MVEIPGIPGFLVGIGGALIEVDNSTIRNCDIGMRLGRLVGAFLSYAAEQSTVTEANFQNCEAAIELIGNNGMQVMASVFEGNSHNVYGENASIHSHNNIYDLGEHRYINTWPTYHSPQYFENVMYMSTIRIDAAVNTADMNLKKNTILDGSSFYVFGDLHFDVDENDFYGTGEIRQVGVYLDDTGDNRFNRVRRNYFHGHRVANQNNGINDTEYWFNCFENTLAFDIALGYNGWAPGGAQTQHKFHHTQGNDLSAAGNCFWKKSPHSTFPGNIGVTCQPGVDVDHFTYWYKREDNSWESLCKVANPDPCPVNNVNRYDLEEAEGTLLIPCGTGNPMIGGPGGGGIFNTYFNSCRCDSISKSDCAAKRDSLLMVLDSIENHYQYSHPIFKRWAKNRIKRCLNRMIRDEVIRRVEEDEDREAAIDLLSAQSDFTYQIMAYGLMMDQMDIPRAKNYLNAVVTREPEEDDFIYSQTLLHKYFESGGNPDTLTQQELETLYDNGVKRNPYSGFSRGVYTHITGELIEMDIRLLEDTIEHRKSEELVTNKVVQLRIYPNPITDQELNVEIEGLKAGEIYNLTILDFTGRIVQTGKIASAFSSVQLNIPAGIYLVRIDHQGTVLMQEKLVKVD
jgi:hypothetical protein